MTDDRPFLDEIAANLDDDLPRLIYADWLEEQGEPRAEFIRVQCELEHHPWWSPTRLELEERARLLLTNYEKEWEPEFHPCLWGMLQPIYRRGFLAGGTNRLEHFVRYADQICEHVPTFTEWVPDGFNRSSLASFFSGRHLSHIQRLDLEHLVVSSHIIQEFESYPKLDNLRSLNFRTDLFENQALAFIIHSPHMVMLEELEISFTFLGSDIMWEFAAAPFLYSVNCLRLPVTGLGADEVRILIRTPLVKQLRTLDLSINQIGNDGIEVLSNSEDLPKLEELSLSGCGLDLTGMPGFRKALKRWPNLKFLSLSFTHLNHDETEFLSTCPMPDSLEGLNLEGTLLDDDGLRMLMDAAWFHQLQYLDLRNNEALTDACIPELQDWLGIGLQI